MMGMYQPDSESKFTGPKDVDVIKSAAEYILTEQYYYYFQQFSDRKMYIVHIYDMILSNTYYIHIIYT